MVKANGDISKHQYFTQGVPQGSILGPLLHIICANNIQKFVKHCKLVCNADDTVNFSTQKLNKCLKE